MGKAVGSDVTERKIEKDIVREKNFAKERENENENTESASELSTRNASVREIYARGAETSRQRHRPARSAKTNKTRTPTNRIRTRRQIFSRITRSSRLARRVPLPPTRQEAP